MYPGNEMLEHLLGDLEVGDNAVLQGADSGDVAGGAAEHALGLGTYRFDSLDAIVETDRHHRGLIQYNSLVAHVDKSVRCAQIDGEIV